MKNDRTKYVRQVREALREVGMGDGFTDVCSGGYRMKLYSLFRCVLDAHAKQKEKEDFNSFRMKHWDSIKNKNLKRMERWVKKQNFPFPVQVVIRGMDSHVSLIVPAYQE